MVVSNRLFLKHSSFRGIDRWCTHICSSLMDVQILDFCIFFLQNMANNVKPLKKTLTMYITEDSKHHLLLLSKQLCKLFLHLMFTCVFTYVYSTVINNQSI